MSSPPPSTTYVPYQAYKSRRHSRNLSNSNGPIPQSPPRPSSGTITPIPSLQPPKPAFFGEEQDTSDSTLASADTSESRARTVNGVGSNTVVQPMSERPLSPSVPTKDTAASPSSMRSPVVKKTTFRRLPVNRNAQASTHSHSRNTSVGSQPPSNGMQKDTRSPLLSPAMSPDPLPNVPLPPPKIQDSTSGLPQPSSRILPVESPSIMKASSSTVAPDEPNVNEKPLPVVQQTSSPRRLAPYRPGFQPLGVRRQLTDDFLSSRHIKRDGEDPGGMKRVERAKLERRLEKLIFLHFPEPGHEEKARPSPRPLANGNRRASIFDFGSLKNMNFTDAGDLWKGIVVNNVVDSAKSDLRAAEQRITPWQEDADVSKCPLCLVSFHPLTNRKHHCRLCGRVICSLPAKPPHRNALCSTLFVVDKETRQIEEVGEGVDYGVRKRRSSGVGSQHTKLEDDTKFLKGVRICRDCRPVLLRQQYCQQALIVPPYVELYQKFISLEWDIENALPKFQELIVSLNQHDSPTKEAVATRKRLLDSFAQYDKLAKKIRSLPCPTGPDSSQERVQLAIMMRANLFLQKNMITLQSIPTLSFDRGTGSISKPTETEASSSPSDVDAALARALQPLLEQESLLEAFIDEAQAQRKFEDVKTLKLNLKEIRQEIEKLLDASDIQSRR